MRTLTTDTENANVVAEPQLSVKFYTKEKRKEKIK